MCGIYGVLELDGSAAAADSLRPMGRLTVHRGPDDEGSYVNGPLAMGMRRLSIIDVAGGHQPLSNEDQTLWLVANGEIYNYRELRATLEAQGHRFKTGSDCETILHLYAQHGDDFLASLNGMFAFALWDARRRRLIVGRDRLGIKPLYLWNDGRRLVFASEAKAILALPGVGTELDHGALASYLGMGYVPAPQSIFKGVTKLPPATLLVAEDGRVEQRCYWRMPSDVDARLSEDEWVARVRARIEESVRMQMVSDVPIGAFLSGGIDSSAVVAFMAAHSDRPVKTYAIGFGGGTAETYYNELPYARQVAQLFGTDHHEIVVRPDVVSLLPSLLWHMDEPIADTAFITTYLVSQFARRDVTVILSGVGGDELFGGYRRYLGGHYQAQFNRLPRGLRRAASALGERLPSDRHSPLLNALRFAKGFLSTAGLPLEERYRSYVEVFADDVVAELLHAPPDSDDDPIAAAFRGAPGADELNRMLAVDAQTQLPDDLLLLTDKMSMAVSLECRVPLLDHELVELAARIPEQIKIRDGRLKHVLKRALQPTLPANILHRKKRGFGTPMGAWLKGDLAPLVKELLSAETVRARGLFRHAEIAKLIAAHAANRVDGTDRLLALLNLEIWSRIYLDQRTPADVADEFEGGDDLKVLYVCHRFPYPPQRGGKIRPFNMIRHLSRDHDVVVASIARSAQEAKDGEGLSAYCSRYEMGLVSTPVQGLRMVARLPTMIPSSMGYFYSPQTKRAVREALARERFDLIFVHCSSVAQYVEAVRGIPKILDYGDMDSQKWYDYADHKSFPLSLGYRLEASKLERSERRLARCFDMCTATTRAEWETLEGYRTGVASDWFPNGVDSEYFAPEDDSYDADTISFVGRMDYYPNQQCMFDFCERTWPLLRARRPAVKLTIVGAEPTPAVRKLGQLPGVTVTGSVPDVRPYLRQSALMVAPLNIARGTQNKILEAMAMGVPVVTSRIAAGGVDAVDPEHFLAAVTPDDYATAILRVLTDPAERRRLALAGRARMLSHHAWDRSMQRLDGIIERCVSQFSPGR